MTVVDEIAGDVRKGLAERKRQEPLAEVEKSLDRYGPARDFGAAVRGDGVRLIAEIKRASPSKGWLCRELDVAATAGSYARGVPISGLDADFGEDVKVFHAGTAREDDSIVTSGGRVLCVTALADNIADAQKACYAGVDKISWDGMTLRRDIGWRAIARYSQDN